MAIEIERKFLVRTEAWRTGASVTPIRQGYILATPNKSVRVRTKGDLGFITVKSSRKESGTNELLELACELPTIDKLRYERDELGHHWEIDVFKGANSGLVAAEVELESADEPVDLREWVGKEVTADPRYLNANLFKNPYQNWETLPQQETT